MEQRLAKDALQKKCLSFSPEIHDIKSLEYLLIATKLEMEMEMEIFYHKPKDATGYNYILQFIGHSFELSCIFTSSFSPNHITRTLSVIQSFISTFYQQ